MSVRLENLTVEHSREPLGIDVPPRFGWEVHADTDGVRPVGWRLDVVDPDARPVWSASDATGADGVDIEYAGPPLRSLTTYRWRARVETSAGTAEGSSTFMTGLLDGDWRGAHWISHPGRPAPLLRQEFALPAPPASAHLVIGAGGYARPLINGHRVEGFELAPGFTDYDSTAQYVVVDVTGLLRPGRNAISLELGRGFYGAESWSTWEWQDAPWHDEPCVRALLVADGTIAAHTDEHWRAIDGPTRFDDVYGGEDFDARLDRGDASVPGFDDAGWGTATTARGPRGRAVNQRQQPIAIAEVIAPERVERRADARWLITFPRVVAGRTRLGLNGDAGEVVTVRAGEKLREDGRPNSEDPAGYYAGRFQECRVTLAGDPLEWAQRFGYQGFRYVEIEASREPVVTAELIHSATARTGDFRCSSDRLNRIHELTVSTVLNNLHGLPTDTPKYEKNGWTGDGMLGAELMLLNLDTHELLAKWSDDIAASRHGAGAPEVIAPHGGWSMDWTPAPTWHAALLLVPWEIHRQRGDVRVITDVWPDAADYLRFELDRWPDGVADTTLGDWVSPDASPGGGNAPEDTRIAATAYLVACLDVAAGMARIVGEDPGPWQREAAARRRAFVDTFFDAARGRVAGTGDAGYRQTHQALALAFDLLPRDQRQRVADGLAHDVAERGNRLNTGALGTKHLLPQLTRFGHAATALAVAEQTEFPSWGLWLDAGATSLWEHWSPDARSHGHYFLGTIDDWLFGSVAGITPAAPGWKRIRIEPAVLGLDWAEASVRTPRGPARVHWERRDGSIELDVEVPIGATATVHVGGGQHALGSGRHRVISPLA